jgi:hypothetical protein
MEFQYEGFDRSGKPQQGTIEAESKEIGAGILRNDRGIIVQNIKPVGEEMKTIYNHRPESPRVVTERFVVLKTPEENGTPPGEDPPRLIQEQNTQAELEAAKAFRNVQPKPVAKKVQTMVQEEDEAIFAKVRGGQDTDNWKSAMREDFKRIKEVATYAADLTGGDNILAAAVMDFVKDAIKDSLSEALRRSK